MLRARDGEKTLARHPVSIEIATWLFEDPTTQMRKPASMSILYGIVE